MLLVAAASVDEPPASGGATHPTFETLRVGGDGAERVAPVFALGAALALVQVVLFTACFALGLRAREARPGFGRWILLSGLVYGGVWVALLLTAWRFANTGAAPIVLGFPLPTAIMVWALWPLPLLFAFLYLAWFDRRVLPPEALDRFRRRLADLRREER